MNRYARPLTAAFMALALARGLAAQALDFKPIAPRVVSVKTAGYGGSYAAIEEGFDTLVGNPAALAYVSPVLSVSRVAIAASGPLFDLPAAFRADDTTDELLDLVAKNNGIHFGLDTTGPFAFGRVDRNVGFGFFNRTIVSADAPSLTKATILVGEEFLLVGGYGLEILKKGPHSLAAGLGLKGFFQVFVRQSGTALSVFDTLSELDVSGIPSILSIGFGIDGGLLYRYGDGLAFGLVCRDLFTPVFSTGYAGFDEFMDGPSNTATDTERLPANLSIGVSYDVPLPEHWVTVTGMRFMMDYRDILAFTDPIYRNPVLNVAMGAELELVNVLTLRAGVRDAYLSTGLGLDLTACEIDLAMYGTEAGLEPGSRPILNLALSLSFEY
jgi:hypothetical protein